MIQWHYAADNDALHTTVGVKEKGRIRIDARGGVILFGPYVDLPAGRCTVRVLLDGPSSGKMKVEIAAGRGSEILAQQYVDIGNGLSLIVELTCDIPEDRRDCEVRLFGWGRVRAEIVAVEIDVARALPDVAPDAGRQVGYESRKSYAEKIASGFFAKYLSGPAILEMGYKGYESGNVPIVPQAIGLDLGYPGYDGEHFPFADDSFDGIYSSHCFEHVGPWKEVLRDWYRILKPGGFLVIVVPHQFLFERKLRMPSPINPDHKRFYTSGSLLAEIEEAFQANTFRVRHLHENDKGFDYDLLPYQGTDGAYEIELVVEKIATPYWHPDDGSVRNYGSGEFYIRPSAVRVDPWEAVLDISNSTECQVWGPYIGLGAGDYIADFHFAVDDDLRTLRPAMMVDVGQFGETIANVWLEGTVAEEFFRTGHVAVPFHNDTNGAFFEFRVWAPRGGSPAKPRFRGVVLNYAQRERPPR